MPRGMSIVADPLRESCPGKALHTQIESAPPPKTKNDQSCNTYSSRWKTQNLLRGGQVRCQVRINGFDYDCYYYYSITPLAGVETTH